MDKGSSRGIISGILGTSHISQQRSNEVVQYEESEYSDKNTSEAAPTKNFENPHPGERPKFHRLGSYIDWGESKFDFSSASNNVDLGSNQVMPHYNPGAGKISSFSSDDNFMIKNNDHNVIPKSQRLSIPRQNSKRRKSLLDTAEDEKIDGAAQAFLSGSPSSKSPPVNIMSSNNNTTTNQGNEDHSILDGLMGSWFFRNKTIEDDDGSILPKPTQMQMEGIGGGALTSRIMTELNINPNSKPEVEKMNTWAPASF